MSRYCSNPFLLSQALSRAFVTAILMTTVSACSPKQKVNNFYKSPAGDELLIHRVNSVEENLRLIALWYTGSAFKEAAIRQSNPQLGATLKVGDFVAIPRDVLLQSEPLPVAFIESQKSDIVKPKTSAKAVAPSRPRKAPPVKSSKSSPVGQVNPQEKAPEVKEPTSTLQETPSAERPREETPPAPQPDPTPNNEAAPAAGSKTEKKESETLEDQLLKNLLTDN